MLVNLAMAIGKLVINGKELSRLAGYTSRVDNLMTTLTKLNKEEDLRWHARNQSCNVEKAKLSTLPQTPGRYVTQDNVIRFDRVPIVTPNGDVLIEVSKTSDNKEF